MRSLWRQAGPAAEEESFAVREQYAVFEVFPGEEDEPEDGEPKGGPWLVVLAALLMIFGRE
jgi:hypothetical protein